MELTFEFLNNFLATKVHFRLVNCKLRKIIAGIVRVVFGVFLTLLASGCLFQKVPVVREQLIEEEKRKTEYTEEAIKNSSVLKELDNLCNEIPKPGKFEFVNKTKGNNSVFISQNYRSDYSFDMAKKLYSDYFAEKDWELVGNSNGLYTELIRFRKEKFEIQIEHGFMGEENIYNFTCSKLP